MEWYKFRSTEYDIKVVVLVMLVYIFGVLFGEYTNIDTSDNLGVANASIINKVDEVYDTAIKEIEDDILEKDIIVSFIMDKRDECPKEIAEVIANEIVDNSAIHYLPIGLYLGIGWVESRYDTMAVSNKRARGIYQIMDKSCGEMEIDHSRIHDIKYNTEICSCIFNSKLDIANGDLLKALYWYVGKKDSYANDVLKVMGEYILYKRGYNVNKT